MNDEETIQELQKSHIGMELRDSEQQDEIRLILNWMFYGFG